MADLKNVVHLFNPLYLLLFLCSLVEHVAHFRILLLEFSGGPSSMHLVQQLLRSLQLDLLFLWPTGPPPPRGCVEIVFSFDATGSMTSCLEQVAV